MSSRITPKDIERAENLEWRKGTFGRPVAISKAKAMAKVIKHPDKLLGRLEAVWDRWGEDREILMPFVERVNEIMSGTIHSAAFSNGFHQGKYSMSPGGSLGSNDRAANILYSIGFSVGRGYI